MIRNSVSDWMWRNNISNGDIIMATGASKASVSMTICGTRNDKRVLGFLRKHGCSDLAIETRKQTLLRSENQYREDTKRRPQ